MKRPHSEHLCHKFQLAMDVLAKPWNGIIMAALADGPARFTEIGDRAPAIGDRILAERLKELEARGLVTRHVEPGPPVRVRYELTELGHGFGKVAEAIGRWGERLQDQATPKLRAARTKGTRARAR